MAKLFCQNTGSYNRKTKTMNGEFLEATRTQINVDAKNYIIIDGVKYEVGEGLRDIQSRTDSKTHIICTMYDILKHSNNQDTVNVMLALPVNYYRNKEYREQYRKLLPRVLTANVDGINKTVYINKVEIYMEGAAAYLLYKPVLKNKVVGIIDVGGNTINCMVYANGKIQIETLMQLDLGMIKLERELIDKLNTKHPGWNIQEYELQDIFKDDTLEDTVNEICDKYVDELKKKLLEKKWNLERMYLFVTGGGAEKLEQSLKKHFKKVLISEYGIYDNVRGMWQAGQVIFSDKDDKYNQ